MAKYLKKLSRKKETQDLTRGFSELKSFMFRERDAKKEKKLAKLESIFRTRDKLQKTYSLTILAT